MLNILLKCKHVHGGGREEYSGERGRKTLGGTKPVITLIMSDWNYDLITDVYIYPNSSVHLNYALFFVYHTSIKLFKTHTHTHVSLKW